MIKKGIAMVALAVVMMMSAFGTAYAVTEPKTAVLNNAKVRFNNGEVQTIQCYNVDGYNYVRARDITNNLDMWIDTIGKNKPGVVVATYGKPTSTGKLETLTQKTAKVRVEQGRLLYEGWASPAECFLLNGRYYFKLTDFEVASEYYHDICYELVERKAKDPAVKEYGGGSTSGITVEWDNETKIIDVKRTEIDLVQMFNDIRGMKTVDGKDKIIQMAEEKACVEEKFKSKGILTSAPREGEILANILLNENEGAYLADGSVNRNNLAGPYNHGSERTFGQCTWYAHGRFVETYGDMILNNVYRRGENLAAWVKSAQDDRCPDLDGVTKPSEIIPGCMAVWEGHVAFVEWVDYDNSGNPITVYFTEGNTQHVGKYYPEYDAKVQVMDFDDFIARQPFVGYVVVK